MELIYTRAAGIQVGISYLNFVGMIVGIFLISITSLTQLTPGLQKDTVEYIRLSGQLSLSSRLFSEHWSCLSG